MNEERPFKPRRLRLEEFDELWAVEYSVRQRAFSVRTVNEMLENNRSNLEADNSVDYSPIAFTYTRDDADELIDKLKRNRDQQASALLMYKTSKAMADAERISLLERSEDRLWSAFRMPPSS